MTRSLPIFPASNVVALRILPGETNIEAWLGRFALDPLLHRYTALVVSALPAEVRHDLMSDRNFHLCDYEPRAGVGFVVPMRIAHKNRASRSVVLKRTLRHRSDAFVKWLIAHELAHAFLRHGGRWPGEDAEEAADGLAAEWGFPRPSFW